MTTNTYGLDADYFSGKITLVQRDLDSYTPKELARELVRLANAADAEACINEAQRLDIAKVKCADR